jgi:4-hydroxybenzoyl-CoA thioesterase
MASYRHSAQVRFGDVDHAGIVYYPHFFIYFHEAMESFFDDNGPQRYAELLDSRRIGFPTVHIETDFTAPLTYGDFLDLDASVAKLGRSSIVWAYRGIRRSDGKLAVSARITVACVSMDEFYAIPIPDDVRAVLERFAS